MISIPDALLERVDAHAEERGETRSGFLQQARRARAGRRRRPRGGESWKRLLGPPDRDSAVDAARLIREDRESH